MPKATDSYKFISVNKNKEGGITEINTSLNYKYGPYFKKEVGKVFPKISDGEVQLNGTYYYGHAMLRTVCDQFGL